MNIREFLADNLSNEFVGIVARSLDDDYRRYNHKKAKPKGLAFLWFYKLVPKFNDWVHYNGSSGHGDETFRCYKCGSAGRHHLLYKGLGMQFYNHQYRD